MSRDLSPRATAAMSRDLSPRATAAMSRDLSPRATVALCAAILIAAALVRWIPCSNDFWLDEIWTWNSARSLASSAEVFTDIHHSNNNHLNTLLMLWLGDRSDWIVYRIPSLLAGVGTVVLAALWGARRGRLEAVLAALLTGSCFALVHFSSEARGYSTAVFFSLAAYAVLELDLARRRRGGALAFGACVVLGFLSHLVFLFFYAGAFLLSALKLWRRESGAGQRALGLARLHGLPLVALGALAWVDLRHLEVGGGNPTDLVQVLARTLGFALGLPVVRSLALPYALLAGTAVALGLRLLRREHDPAFWLYLVTIVLAPLLVIGVLRPDVVAVRYFLIGITFTLLLLAALLAQGLRRGGSARAAALVVLAVFVVGNAAHTAAFLRHGRGGFHDALLFMARESDGPRVRVGSDHDFRNGMVLRFYARYLPSGKSLEYVPRAGRGRGHAGGAQQPPEWMVVHRAARPAQPPPVVRVAGGRPYRLVAQFDHAAISGFYWAVYRAASAPVSSGGG